MRCLGAVQILLKDNNVRDGKNDMIFILVLMIMITVVMMINMMMIIVFMIVLPLILLLKVMTTIVIMITILIKMITATTIFFLVSDLLFEKKELLLREGLENCELWNKYCRSIENELETRKNADHRVT